MGVIRHMKHSCKSHTPGVDLFWLRLLDEDRHAPVDRFRQFSVALAAERRAGSGIRIYQTDFVSHQCEAASEVGDTQYPEKATQGRIMRSRYDKQF